MRNLRSLDISDNLLEYLPISMSHCLTIESIEVQRNNLRKISHGIGNLTKLSYFDISENLLDDIPRTLVLILFFFNFRGNYLKL